MAEFSEESEANTSEPNPFLEQWSWMKGYNGSIFADDMVAAIIVTILLVPQSLAYALLAGLPPQVGIYVSIFPLIAYALFGSSRVINVGPTAVISLMTAACIAILPEGNRLIYAAALALMTGGILLIAGLLKAGFIMNFVSRPVVSAYITGAALLIVFSQLKHVLGVQASGNTVFALFGDLKANAKHANMAAVVTGTSAMVILWSVRKYVAPALISFKVNPKIAQLLARTAPIVVIIAYILLSAFFDLAAVSIHI